MPRGYIDPSLGQAWIVSSQCPTGGKEAEELYQLGRNYRHGRKGFPQDRKRAKDLFFDAGEMGSAKAAIQIGQMFMYDYSTTIPAKKRYPFMLKLYNDAANMGCPEAYMYLAECYQKGWGVREDKKKGWELVRKAAEEGAPKGMEWYGVYLMFTLDKYEEGRKWLERSIALGNGDACHPLATYYEYIHHDVHKIIETVRAGAKMGSDVCLLELEAIYLDGLYGQDKDKEYATCIGKVEESIDMLDPPKPIENFDKICPPKPILPWRGRTMFDK